MFTFMFNGQQQRRVLLLESEGMSVQKALEEAILDIWTMSEQPADMFEVVLALACIEANKKIRRLG